MAQLEAGQSAVLGKKPDRILILANKNKEGAEELARTFANRLVARKITVEGIESTGVNSVEDSQADLAIVLGGDGAILRSAFQMGRRQIPVLGINLGRLGFLAELFPDEFESRLDDVLAGHYVVTHHLMLDVQIGGETGPQRRFRVLNEIVVTSSEYRMVEVDLVIDGQNVAQYTGDGLILATPIGSTAHSLAAGGPILEQRLPAVVITPICPHALTWRPLVESADRKFRLSGSAVLTARLDGHLHERVDPGQHVRVEKSKVDFLLARLPGRSYFSTLSEKLLWGNRPRRVAT